MDEFADLEGDAMIEALDAELMDYFDSLPNYSQLINSQTDLNHTIPGEIDALIQEICNTEVEMQIDYTSNQVLEGISNIQATFYFNGDLTVEDATTLIAPVMPSTSNTPPLAFNQDILNIDWGKLELLCREQNFREEPTATTATQQEFELNSIESILATHYPNTNVIDMPNTNENLLAYPLHNSTSNHVGWDPISINSSVDLLFEPETFQLMVPSVPSSAPDTRRNSLPSNDTEVSNIYDDITSNVDKIETTVSRGSKNKYQKLFEFDYSNLDIPFTMEDGTGLTNTVKSQFLSDKRFQYNQNSLVRLQSQSLCKITRNRYSRSIESFLIIEDSHEFIAYEQNPKFSISRPYEYQFVRYQIDPTNGLAFNPTRAGLCPYCHESRFFNIKNSSYSQHLASNHGIFPDNYLAPEPYNFGSYRVKKCSENRKTLSHERIRDGVICPVCHDIIEANCSKLTRNERPLMGYLRHFKQVHRRGKPNAEEPQKYFQQTNCHL